MMKCNLFRRSVSQNTGMVATHPLWSVFGPCSAFPLESLEFADVESQIHFVLGMTPLSFITLHNLPLLARLESRTGDV